MKKGQESAPIEVLIGVTILTFVLIIAMGIFQNSCSSQYEQKLNAGFSKFARDLEFVYMGATGTSISTTLDLSVPEGCASIHLQSIKLVQGQSATCRARLGKDSCMVLIATLMPDNPSSTAGTTNFLTVEVIDIPEGIEVVNKLSECNQNLNGISLEDVIDEKCTFKPSYYSFILKKVSSTEIDIS